MREDDLYLSLFKATYNNFFLIDSTYNKLSDTQINTKKHELINTSTEQVEPICSLIVYNHMILCYKKKKHNHMVKTKTKSPHDSDTKRSFFFFHFLKYYELHIFNGSNNNNNYKNKNNNNDNLFYINLLIKTFIEKKKQ